MDGHDDGLLPVPLAQVRSVRHREYYELFAFFNQTADADRYDQEPLLLTPTDEAAEVEGRVGSAARGDEARIRSASRERLPTAQREWEQQVVAEVDWKPLRPTQVTSQGGATCTVLDDGSVLVSGTSPDTDTYTIQGDTELKRDHGAAAGSAAATNRCRSGGPGRADDGGFVVSKVKCFRSRFTPAENVKFVRVELPRHDYLTMSEVQVFRGDENVARAGTATQSSTAYEGHAKLAIDGSTHPHFATGRSISHTAFNDNPWWEVDLGEPTRVDRVVLWNEDAHPYRLAGARVTLLDPDRKPVWQQTLLFSPDLTATLTVDVRCAAAIRLGRRRQRAEGFSRQPRD